MDDETIDEQFPKILLRIEQENPAFVVRKLLPPSGEQRIDLLIIYLKQLHALGLATNEYTTLLINCFTKLNREHDLESFLSSIDLSHLDTSYTIEVCDQAGFHSQALNLARRIGNHKFVLRSIISQEEKYASENQSISQIDPELALLEEEEITEQLNQQSAHSTSSPLEQALDYLFTLDEEDVIESLLSFGPRLFTKFPERTTTLMIEKCMADPTKFLHLFVGHDQQLVQFLNHCLSRQFEHQQSTSDEENTRTAQLIEMLIGAYLRLSHTDKSRENEYNQQVLKLLRENGHILDMDSVLMVAMMNSGQFAVEYILEKEGRFKDLLHTILQTRPVFGTSLPPSQREAKERETYTRMIQICERYGTPGEHNFDLNLWNYALCSLSALHARAGDCIASARDDAIKQILEAMSRLESVPLLPLLDTLTSNPEISLSTVQDFIVASFQSVENELERVVATERRKEADVEEAKQAFQHFYTQPTLFTSYTCCQCSQPIRTPLIHFMCGHSYHESCVSESRECPLCLPKHFQIQQRYHSITHMAEEYTQDEQKVDQTIQQMEVDKMDVVFAEIGKGAISTAW
ncbi:putative Vacuolar protein sorting-associated protein 11 like protein [Blattamonas nauphoetae]|uniref:Vacuolar protein sorting-associated protein 11 like protein n=1 Tax=Blattamonas nauphoetae TaxID=2049346 RepID=A0ABQ9Y9U8_9EUKA|nr:putative Vacuolar protein sorting-associated protein 11 like protein [Blattamonas nauphoetae]